MSRINNFFQRLTKKTEGAAAVEFAIVLNLFLILILGMLDFGHAWFMRQVIVNASREGARYGVVYRGDNNGNRIPPSALAPSIQTWVLQDSTNGGSYGLVALLPGDSNPAVTPSGPGYTTGTVGTDLVVTVVCTKHWWVINNFIPGLGPTLQMASQTVMRVE
jgi:Flp pilus assembly protein TadG